jgi:hypothetical protein
MRLFSHAFDLKADQVRAGFLNGVTHREFKCDTRRRTAFASALKSKPSDVIFQAEQFHVSAVALQIRTNLLQCAEQSRLKRDWMEAVNEQETANENIPQQSLLNLLSFGASIVDQLQNARQSVAMQLEQRMETFMKEFARLRVPD